MNKDLCELTIIRLQTELENSIGFSEYYLKQNDYLQYHVWDLEIENILNEIIKLGSNYD